MIAGSAQARAALLVLSLSMFSLATASLVVLGVGAEIAHSLRVSPGSAGLLVTAFALPYAVLAPLLQWLLSSRFGARALVAAGAALTGCGLAWTAAAITWELMLVGRVITAVGGAILSPAALTAATHLARPEQCGRALATVYAGFTLASVIGVPAGTQLGQAIGWRGTFLAVAALSLAIALAVTRKLPAIRPVEPLPPLAWAGLLRRPGVQRLLGASVLHLAAQFVALAVMPVVLTSRFGLDPAHLPWALLAFGLGGVLGNWAAGEWSDRLSPTAPIRASFVGTATALFVLTFPLNAWAGAAAFVLLALSGTLFRPPQLVILTRVVTVEERPLALGLNTSASYVGLAAGSALAAAVVTLLGAVAVGWLGLVLLGTAWVCIRGGLDRSKDLRP